MLLRIHIILAFVCLAHALIAQPFSCSGEFILTVSPNADSSRFYKIVVIEDSSRHILFEEFSEHPGPYLNAIGYRRSDNYIYGIAPNTNDLYRLDASGKTTFLHHFDEFDDFKTYNAGAVTPDSKFLVVLSGISSSFPYRSSEIILIDLGSADYTTTITPLSTLSGDEVFSLDIAFDPISGVLYGYDQNKGRLITISLSGALVDDIAYPVSETIDIMAAMFFDPWGDLFGYAKHHGELGIKAFYQINKETGGLNFLLEGPFASASDGCSCPYRVELVKSVQPTIAAPCTQVEYTFKITNTSGIIQTLIRFEDVFPDGFDVLEVQGNVYGGLVTGINTGTLVIHDMMIPPGIDSFVVRVSVNDLPNGIYKNQAVLSNLSAFIGSVEFSDDPNTLMKGDSTTLEILGFEFESLDTTLIICPGDTLQLDASLPHGIFSYQWQDGSSKAVLETTEAGIYDLIARNDCETVQITFVVESSSEGFVLDLGPDMIIALGDRVILNPGTQGAGNPIFNWSEIPGQTINCDGCPGQDLRPIENTTYYLTLTDEKGCVFIDSVNVTVEKAYDIYVPNTFSPNNDGINDMLYVYGESTTLVEQFVIFNRWGGEVFESKGSSVNDVSMGWNGMVKGQTASSGVYIWVAKIKYIDGETKYYSGEVTVIY